MNTVLGTHVIHALREGKPLVALESALLTHGLPRPVNLETALAMEAAVEEEGAVPATIGILQGRIIIGLTHDELETLAWSPSPWKVGIRELPAMAARHEDGGTTVSATAYLARRYGISVFATGGIGGVHREGQYTFDISADLTVLGRTPITVVSSGAKAILDLKLTLEYLETAGITVAGYRTASFPAFYSAASPYPLTLTLDNPAQVARVALARDGLDLPGALLVANPVPAGAEIPWDRLMEHIAAVAEEIRSEGIAGQDVTPQMLRRLFALTEGATLKANLALLRHNARLGGEIARALTEERRLAGGTDSGG
jgi:pseudouridylate synthase